MSDFLSRLAARAVAETPLMSPTAPAHGAGTVAATMQPVAADEPPVARALPSAPAVRSEPPTQRAAPPAAPGPDERSVSKVERERAPATTDIPDAAAPPPLSAAQPREPDAQAVPDIPVAAAVPVPAVPIVRRVVESRVERTRAPATATADEPPVRVHIGRLEVRANFEQPPAKPQRREPERPQGSTLSDYLRGRRSA